MSELDPRLYQTTIVLAREQHQQRTLTAAEARLVLDNFPTVAQQMAKWRLSTRQAGRLFLIDEGLIGEIERFLDSAAPT